MARVLLAPRCVSSSHPRMHSSRLALLFLFLTLAALALEFWGIRASLAGLFQ